ncbi:bacteriohemerythrin [Teredinibacter franksiae]|uniref:bacteriohemerythrin n=1 Tax=Teredinibacter franksiae TaxID=2761453 RepID=UPI0016271850|nr:hemerythrin family protein [Teredinibacter franksiae]
MTTLLDTLNPKYALGVGMLDHDHREFCELVNQLHKADTVDFIRLFSALYAQTEAHFNEEKTLMLNTKFSGINEHLSEHARFLSELKTMDLAVRRGAIIMGRQFATTIVPEWFLTHIATMDKALAAHAHLCNPAQKIS